jgi:hypothetical protein
MRHAFQELRDGLKDRWAVLRATAAKTWQWLSRGLFQ